MSGSFRDNINCFNVSNESKVSNVTSLSIVSNHYTFDDDRPEFLRWLSPLEPRIRHQDIQTRRADNVGGWLLKSDEFRRWCDSAQQKESEHATLFCCGDPAVGKTFFSSLVVDRLCDKAKGENIAVACFYVDFAAREEQSPTNMLGSLLKQIVGGLERIPSEIRRVFRDYRKVIGGRVLRVPEIVKMLQAVTSLRPTFICVDALDECVEGHRHEVLYSLRQILEKSPNTRIFLTGRRHILGEIERHLGGRVAVLSMKPNSDDILGYTRMRLSKDTSLDEMDGGLGTEIIKSIAENIPETFLLIPLTMDAILGETTASGRRRKLRAMTDGLDLRDVYGATLERIKEQGGEKTRLGMAALMWISHSERLLQLDELSHALAVEIGSTDLDSERIPSVETLLSCCLGLVVIDKKASVVRLIHFTLQEYLSTCPDLFGATHSIMAETCLTYLNFQNIKEISPLLLGPPRSAPFLQYSSLCWGAHARRKASRVVVSLALKLFSQIETHISTKLLLLDIVSRACRDNGDIPASGRLIGFSGLHCASVFGIVEIVTTLMGQPNTHLNKRDFLGITPLIWAAICGQSEVVKLLLEHRTTIPDKLDRCFHRTAFSWAAGKGHEGTVKILLGRAYAGPGGANNWWSKAHRVVNMILGRRYVNPNTLDKYGQTPLSFASEGGHSDVVRLLLARKDARPDAADGYGRTPLLLASRRGQEAVVEILAERGDVNIDRPDNNGETPLLSAAGGGYPGVLGLLLGRKEFESDMGGKHCQPLLWLAAKKGHDGVVKLLLAQGNVNPDIPDRGGRTPLLLAASNGHDIVVKLLLGREDVNPDMQDNGGRTPLWTAAANGHNIIVKLLLGRRDVNPDRPDKCGRAPLSRAAGNGRKEVVKLLLRRKDVNPDAPDNGGRTPLSRAAGNGRNEVVKLLLRRKDVNPNMRDNGGRTPLWLAAGNGHDAAVKLLLGRGDVNPDVPDNYGQTPLSWAAGSGHDSVVELFLEREDVNFDMPDNGGRAPLSWAAGNGRIEVVKLLLGLEIVNPDMLDNSGRAPLSWAAGNGRTEVVEILLGREGVNPDIPDSGVRAPLSWAAGNGRKEVVRLLLGQEAVNPDMLGNDGLTPLSLAAMNGHDGVVKLLLGQEDVNPNLSDQDGLTPLSLVSKRGRGGGRKKVVDLLRAQRSAGPT